MGSLTDHKNAALQGTGSIADREAAFWADYAENGGGESGAPPSLLATHQHNPAAVENKSTTQVAYADADAANLKIDFTVPASGKVLVRASCRISNFNANAEYGWNLREGAADVAGTNHHVWFNSSTGQITFRHHDVWIITGLTPGAAKSYKLGHSRIAGTATNQINVGGASGPFIMEVWDASPTLSQQVLTGGVRPHKFVTKAAGTNLNNEAGMANLDTNLDLTIPAVVGDVIEAHLSGFWQNQAPWALIDAQSIVGGVPVNSWGGQGAVAGQQFVMAWRGLPGVYSVLGGSAWKTIVAGDLSNGLVTVRLRYFTQLAGTKVLDGAAAAQTMFSLKNLGQAA